MKKIVVTYAGRKKFLEILFSYILKYRKHIDEYHIYASTDVEEDLKYIDDFWKDNLDFVKVFTREQYGIKNPELVDPDKRETYSNNFGIPHYDLWNIAWVNCQDENSVYLRLDDDIVFVEESLFTDFIDFRIKNPDYPVIYPMIINNVYSNQILQDEMGVDLRFRIDYKDKWESHQHLIKEHLLTKGIPDRMIHVIPENIAICPTGWGNLDFCYSLHDSFIENLENGNIDTFKRPKNGNPGIELEKNPPMSINCVSWLGKSFKEYTSKFGKVWQEEPWISVYLPILEGKNNYVYFNSLVSHFSYYRQIEIGLLETDILSRYKKISENI
jgi:hypothetical protein